MNQASLNEFIQIPNLAMGILAYCKKVLKEKELESKGRFLID
jgi:hypothetical protein